MIVTFKNTGIIEEADICFDGLTVIAGENDTGKSTIGKLMFSIIKSFRKDRKYDEPDMRKQLKHLVDSYYSTFKKKVKKESPIAVMVKKSFKDIKNDAISLIDAVGGTKEKKEKIKSNILEKVSDFMKAIKQVSDFDMDIEKLPVQIFEIIESKREKEDILKSNFRSFVASVFGKELINKYALNQEYFISGKEGKDIIFEISGTDDSMKLRLNNKFYFEDVTFIASPVLFELKDMILASKTLVDVESDHLKQVDYLAKKYIPEYIRDFMLKVTDVKMRRVNSEIVDDIQQIIGGNFYYDNIEENFLFEKDNKIFKGLQVALGVEPLGAISILYQGGFLDEKSLLIIDEPESHIHPKWQIKFAEVLVKLVKEDKHILLTSHSPYLIEALKLYSDQLLEESKVNFYLSERIEKKSITQIYDVTHDISPIFDTLAEPLDKLESLQ